MQLTNFSWIPVFLAQRVRRSVIPFAFSILALGFASPSVSADDWPQWLGPNRNSVSKETIAPWKSELKPLWKVQIGSGFSVPVVANGKLYVHAEMTDKDAEEVICLDANTGKIVWRESYERAPYKSALGAGPRATPTYHNGKLYTFGITGVLSCYDGKTGKRIWQKEPYKEFSAGLPAFGICASPLVTENGVVVPVGGPGSSVVSFDLNTGNVKWKALDEPASCASPILFPKAGSPSQFDIVVQTSLRILGLDPENGSIRWEHPLVFQPSGVSPTPIVSENMIACTTQDSGTLVIKITDNKSDVAWWKHETTSYFSTGGLGANNQVLIVTNKLKPLPRADLQCIDMKDGKVAWTKTGLGYFHFGLIVTADQKLLILSDAGNLSLVDTLGGFKQLSSTKICGGTFANPVLSNGLLYFRDAKEVGCVSLKP